MKTIRSNDIGSGAETIAAEQILLGAVMLNPEALDLVADVVRPDLFSDPLHAQIWSICQARISKGHMATPPAIALTLQDHDGLKELGGARYLVRLAGAGCSPREVRHYARLMIEDKCRRLLDSSLSEGLSRLSGGEGSQEVVTALLHSLQSLPEMHGEESTYSLMRAVTDAVQSASDAYAGATSYLKTGIKPLDAIIKGLAPGDLMLLGGATSMGKTSAALEIATNVAFEAGRCTAFVSLEMSRQELATRMISARSRIPYASLRDAENMEEKDFRKWLEASKPVSEGALRIVPKHIRDIPAIHAACKRAGQEMGLPLSLIVVDYAQLVRGEGKSRYDQMTSVSIGLKGIAGMLNCPVIGLVQLSRDIGFREDKRPQLSDIKETGQFENDADQVVFCHREDYWLRRQGPKIGKDGQVSIDAKADWETDMARCRNKMELIVRKNRHGRLATAEVGFHDATNRFWSLDDPHEQEDF